jgi:glucosylceramidase
LPKAGETGTLNLGRTKGAALLPRPSAWTAVLAASLLMVTAVVAQAPTWAAGATKRGTTPVSEWLTTGDQAQLLAPQQVLHFGVPPLATAEIVTVSDTTSYQTLTGFGAAVTDSSAWLLSQLPATTRDATLASLFGPGAITVVRVPLGSSEFVVGPHYSYDDLASGASDPTLARFSIARDETYLIPLLRRIRAINPAVRIVATPWSAPGWMKTSGSLIGGTMNPTWADTYARYLVLTLKAFAADGVRIDALTVQDEPEFSPGDYPGMTLTGPQESDLVGRHLGPALRAAGLAPALLGYDHNWDDSVYPAGLLANRTAAPYLAGVAFHCYAGDPAAQATVHNAAPRAAIWLTECSGGSWSAGFGADLVWETRNLFVGGTRNWASAVLWWNLALDPTGGPHNGGCATCRGVLTVDPAAGTVTPNAEYWTLSQATVATRPGAVRVASSTFGNGDLETTAFRNPDGSHALLVVNSGTTPRTLQIRSAPLSASATATTLAGGSVATFSW